MEPVVVAIIPCLDEEVALPDTLKALPRHVEGFDAVEWLVIDDGSTDRTVEVAREEIQTQAEAFANRASEAGADAARQALAEAATLFGDPPGGLKAAFATAMHDARAKTGKAA